MTKLIARWFSVDFYSFHWSRHRCFSFFCKDLAHTNTLFDFLLLYLNFFLFLVMSDLLALLLPSSCPRSIDTVKGFTILLPHKVINERITHKISPLFSESLLFRHCASLSDGVRVFVCFMWAWWLRRLTLHTGHLASIPFRCTTTLCHFCPTTVQGSEACAQAQSRASQIEAHLLAREMSSRTRLCGHTVSK